MVICKNLPKPSSRNPTQNSPTIPNESKHLSISSRINSILGGVSVNPDQPESTEQLTMDPDLLSIHDEDIAVLQRCDLLLRLRPDEFPIDDLPWFEI